MHEAIFDLLPEEQTQVSTNSKDLCDFNPLCSYQ